MDAFYTDVRRDLAEWREARGLPADPMRAYLASGYQESDRGRPRRRRAGRMELIVTNQTTPRPCRAHRAVQPPRRRPAQHQLRRGQHLRQGRGDRPGHRAADRAPVGQGLRRRPRHPDGGRAWPRCAWTGCARSSTSTPASSARTRWSRPSTTACTARAAPPRPSTPRCTAWSTPPTSTTSTPTPASRSPPRPTARRSPRTSSATASSWVPWRRPGFQLGLDIAAIKRANPQAIGCILGGHGITAWGETSRGVRGQLARHHPDRRGVHRRARHGRARSAPSSRATSRCPRPSAAPRRPRSRPPSAASPRPTSGWSATSPTATSCSTSSAREKLQPLAALGTSCPDHFLRTKVPPMVLDLPGDRARGGDGRPG